MQKKRLNKNIKFSLLILVIGLLLSSIGLLLGGYRHNVIISQSFPFKISLKENYNRESIFDNLNKFSGININVSSSNINILEGDRYSIEYSKDIEVDYNIKNNDLYIAAKTNNITIVSLDINDDTNFITVTVPKNALITDIKTKSNSGNFTLKDISLYSNSLTLGSGNVYIENVKLDRLDVSSKSGTTKINDVEANEIRLKNNSGDITLSKIRSNILEASSKSGNLQMESSEISEGSIIQLNSGNMKIENSDINNIEVKLTSGYANLAGTFSGKIFFIGKSGNFDLNTTLERELYSYDLHTKSGEVRINKEKFGNTSVNRFDKNLNMLEVSLTSGNININFEK